MANNSHVVWQTPPKALVKSIEQWVQAIDSKIETVLFDESQSAEEWMKENRPWGDISGNARRGLRVQVTRENVGWIMLFIHSMEYGVYLELARGGQYAVIIPGIRRTVPRLKQQLKGIANVRS